MNDGENGNSCRKPKYKIGELECQSIVTDNGSDNHWKIFILPLIVSSSPVPHKIRSNFIYIRHSIVNFWSRSLNKYVHQLHLELTYRRLMCFSVRLKCLPSNEYITYASDATSIEMNDEKRNAFTAIRIKNILFDPSCCLIGILFWFYFPFLLNLIAKSEWDSLTNRQAYR